MAEDKKKLKDPRFPAWHMRNLEPASEVKEVKVKPDKK